MKTNQAEYKTDIARLAEAMAKREQDNQRWTVGFGIAQIVVTLSMLGAGFAFLSITIGSP